MEFSDAVNQRVIKFLQKITDNKSEGGQAGLAKRLGFKGRGFISQVINGHDAPSRRLVDALIKHYPEARNFIYGNEPTQQPADEIKSKTNIPHIPSDPNGKVIPMYDTEVFGGIKPNLNDAITMRPVGFISIPIFSQGDTAVQVTGHSMKGLINHMDWVIIKRITNRDNIIYGEAHMIVTKTNNIRTVKFLKKSKDPKKLKLVSYNVDQFEDQDIPWEEVLEVWRVCGLFRTV